MIRWTKKMPKRSGVYLTKDREGTAEIVEINYAYGDRFLYDYPHRHASVPLEKDTIYMWGARIS